MSSYHSNFGRGRGFGPQGARAARCYGRPRFPRPPFRHAGPVPRPALHPASFGMPWQPSNIFFQPNLVRGSPQFRTEGRRRRLGGYNVRFPAPSRPPVPPDCEEAAEPASSNLQVVFDQETVQQLPLLGSEEERQQKITETADRLKQKLSSFSSNEMTDIWNEIVPSDPIKEDCIENKRIPLVGYKSIEINLTHNDLKDIGRINSDNVKLASMQHTTDIYNITNNTDNDVILDENENGSHLVIPSNQMTNLENVPDDNEYVENNLELHEPIDNSHNLDYPINNSDQSDLHGNDNIENELIESDLQFQYDTSSVNISVDQDGQQQDTLQEIEVYPTDATKEQNESETLNLQTFPIDSVDQDISQKEDQETPQNEDTNLEVQESVLNSHVHVENSNSNNSILIQPALADVSVNNVALDNQLSKVKENSFHSGPPKLSPHTEQELPVDFDPSTPPPILLKQDQSRILPPYSIPSDLPPLFDPTAPPPSIKCLLGSNISHEDANPAWSNAQNPMPTIYKNVEVHTGLNTAHGGFMVQQLPLEISCQNNFLPPHIDPVNFSPIFPMSNSHSGINAHVPSILPQMHATPHYVSPSSLPDLSPSSDLSCSMNKDDGLDDMQEAMKFAKEMTNITGKTVEESKSSSKSLSESSISINPVSDVESIALPPGRPKVKSNKLKKIKEDICNKKKIAPEEQSTADYLSSEETIQDANMKSKDVVLMKDQDRPKVIFNLNNKTKVVNPRTAWEENNEKKNGMTQSMESEKTRATSSIIKQNFENILRRSNKEKNLKSNENNSGILSELIANQDVTLPRKKSQKDVHTEKFQCSSVSLYPKVKMQKLRSHIEKRGISNMMMTSWKNKIINRFLKMSKNDIYNMVNNTSLKKFDIIMKRLVKEKKPTLSLEMRHAQNEKMKLYDQQEFMNQLNAMLDTNSVVSITDLPTEFIHHLNEVLQLDVQPDNHTESAAASSSQYEIHSENANYAFNPVAPIIECANKTTTSNNVSQERVRNKGHTKTPYNKDAQAYNKTNDLNFKDDTCNTTAANDSISSNLLTLQHDLDDIFSEVTKKNQIPASLKERKRCSMGQQNAKKFDTNAISRSVEDEILENDRPYRLDDCSRWDEKCDRWKRKEWEDPHAYRNLTKEEWEARYGTQANTTPSLSIKRTVVNNKTLPNRGSGRKVYPRRRYSSESSRHPPNTRHRSLEKDKHKKSRRHSDDRRHSIGYLEHDHNHNSNSTSRSSSSSSSSTSSSSNSNSSNSSNSSKSSNTDSSDNTNVTKLLRVIKQNEKVAKKMSLNEAIRDEVNAEIERERRSRKLRKNRKSSKSQKQKKAHYKKRRQSKKMTSSSNSSSEKDNNNETTDKLLTESEIKKEIVENQTTQEVIVKEEIDIGQEENIEDHFASASSLVVENKVAYSFSTTSQSRLESPSTQEIPLATVNATQLHAEDRLPTASPTQPKTKAQLKQMPETSDMNDNKVPLNAFTCIPEDWSTLNPANIFPESFTEDFNKSGQTTGIGCNKDKPVPSTFDSFTKQDNVSGREAGENALSQQLDATTCTFTESSAKVQEHANEISPTDNNISSVAASTSSVSSVPVTATRKRGASKKIDIKTYYERTIQRRMNNKLESRRPVDAAAMSPRENSLAAKTTEPAIAANKSTFVSTYGGSVQDPRLVSAGLAVVPCAASSKDGVAQATATGKNVRQKEKRVAKGSTIAELAPGRPEKKNSSRIVDSGSVVKKINRDKSKDEATDSTSVLSNVVIAPKIVAPRSKRSGIKESVADKKSQSQVSSDPKRFKNIRSEGSKELKLKKEIAREQKLKKKPASKSVGLASTKVPLEETTRAEETVQETMIDKKIDNIGNVNNVEIERVQLTGSRKTKVNSSSTEPPAISSGNADNNELSRDVAEAKERSAGLDILEREKTDVSNVSNVIVRKRASKTTRNKEARYAKRAKSAGGAEVADKEDQSAKEIPDVVPGLLDASTTSKIALEVPEGKTSSESERAGNGDLSTSEVQQSDATKDTSSNHADQGQIKKSSSQDSPEVTIDRDVSGITELDGTSRSDGIDVQSKEDQSSINSDVKGSNTELAALNDTHKSANEDRSKKTADELSSSASNENFQEQQGTASSDSIGSPFKGFLQETMMDFEEPNLFDFKLDGVVDAGKKSKIFLDGCNVNYGTAKDTRTEGRQNCGTTLEPGTDYDPNINANENFDVAFNHPLFTSDKGCTACEKSDKSATDESGEERVRESPSEIIASTLHDENDINIGGGTERPLMSKEGYTCAGLAMKESMFINEEEIIPGETRSKDLASKLKTTIDPSLSDALETTISDDALRLPESQGAEHLDNHIYLETNISAEKADACDKLPGFDSDEHLDSDMFYLDDRLGAATFDNKDDESVHFPVHQQSPRYDITPAVITPETTLIANSSKPAEDCQFDLKSHAVSSSASNDAAGLVEGMPTDPPRTLNIPTKAALKEPATNLFLKSPSDVPTATKETLGILDKTRQSETELNYHTAAWHVSGQNNVKTHPPETRENAITQNFVNVNTSLARKGTSHVPARKDGDVERDKPAVTPPSSDIEKCLRMPVVELRKMKELDHLLEKRGQKNPKRMENGAYEGKRNGTILHKLKDKRQIKRQSKSTKSNKISLVKRLKKMRRSQKIVGTTRETILTRMLEIDLEMQKLMTEKLKLHEILRSNILSTENSTARGKVTREDSTVADIQPEAPTVLMSQLTQNSEVSCGKQLAPSSRPIKERKRVLSHNSEDEITSHTPVLHQKTKMPVIKWKKKPRLEQTIRREEEDKENEEEEEELDETTETSESKKVEDSSIGASEDIQKPDSNAMVDDEAREEKIPEKSDKVADNDSSRAIGSGKSPVDKSADDRSEWQDFAEGETTERAKHSDIDKRNDTPPPVSEAARTNSQPSSGQVRSTPEPLSIYSDDSTWDSLVQNTASEVHDNRKATGLALLNETLKKELAKSRKKAIVRKKQKQQLDNYLRTVNNLTIQEEELPLSKLYIRKLQQKRDLLDSLSQRKEDLNLVVDPNVLKNVDEVINAVAENRVEELYEPQSGACASDDVPATSDTSPVLQPDKHQFYVDAEANANSDWPCREKENVEEAAMQQENNDMSGTDGSNHVFKAVSQDKVPFYDEHNMEPDSSITPEETLMESHSSDCERDRPKVSNNVALCNFDIKVSVPKILIKNDFSLGLLQKLKDTEGGVANTALIDSTTNVFSANTERLVEKDKDSQNITQAVKPIMKENRKDEKGGTKDKRTVDASGKEEVVDSVTNAPSAPQSSTAKSGYSDVTENEESGDSIASNRYDKIAIKDTERDSDSTVEKTDTRQKKSDAESDQLSNDAIALKQDCQNMENVAVKVEEKSNPGNKSGVFERILDLDQSTGSSVLADLASEKSEESNEMSNEQKSGLEHTSTFSFNKAIAKSGETSKKLCRKHNSLTPVRRSTRNANENVKSSSKIKEADANSNSSEQESSIVHEKNSITRSRSKSPIRDERITNNGRKKRVAQKKLHNVISRKVGAKSTTKVEDPTKYFDMIAESVISKNKITKKRKQHMEWQMKNCKVRLIDCKSALFKYVNPEVLDRLGIVNPCASNDTSCVQSTTSNQNTIIPIAVSDKSFFFPDKSCDKVKSEVEILEEKPIKENNDKNLVQESVSAEIDEEESTKMQYTVHKGPILDIKVFENSFLAASEDSKIYRYSQMSNGILNIYKGHKSAVTCLYIYKSDVAGVNKELMYSGSLDGTLRCYNITTSELVKNPAQINSAIQCMDQAWGIIFIGTKSGHVSRFHIKTGAIKGNSIPFSDKSVLALKATNEGPRRILIVASRNQPVTIRDAQTGLFLRTVSNQKNHTVYSLLRHNNLIYCGTSSTSINVFDFTTGEQVIQYSAGVGIVCMRLYKQLLFAGCYDGNIYVFDINNHKLVCSIHGPGNMLLSIEVVNNKIIAGSKDKRLHSWKMPTQVRALL